MFIILIKHIHLGLCDHFPGRKHIHEHAATQTEQAQWQEAIANIARRTEQGSSASPSRERAGTEPYLSLPVGGEEMRRAGAKWQLPLPKQGGWLAPNGCSPWRMASSSSSSSRWWWHGRVTSGAEYLSPRRFPRRAKGVATNADGGVAELRPPPGGDGDLAAAELRPRGWAGIFVVNPRHRGSYRPERGLWPPPAGRPRRCFLLWAMGGGTVGGRGRSTVKKFGFVF